MAQRSRVGVGATGVGAAGVGAAAISAVCTQLRMSLSPTASVACEGEGIAFAVAATTWNYRYQLARRPWAVVAPTSVEDVGAALRAARAAGLRVSVRDGGHSPTGRNLAPRGLTLDLAPHASGCLLYTSPSPRDS